MMKTFLPITVFALTLLAGSCMAAEPQTMIHAVMRTLSPKIRPGSFESMPKEIWRAGTRYLRVNEQPDPQRHIHGVVIISEPDAWLWNRFDNTARHVVDKGPDFSVHAPVFTAQNNKELDALETGRERDFFTSRHAIKLPDARLDKTQVTAQRLQIGPAEVTLYLRQSDGLPFQITLNNPGNADEQYSIRYDAYEPALPFDPARFRLAPSARVTEAN